MLRICNLNKSYGDLHVITDLNLDVSAGEVVAIIGPSGAGKSTLLRCLNYLEKLQKGIIEIDGVCVDAENHTEKDIRNLRSKTSMVFQNYNLFANKNCLQNVLIPLEMVQKIKKEKALVIAENLLKKVGLEDKKFSYPAHMSGGQQQRAGIARALAVNPKCILFDEPTSSLDPELTFEVKEVIRQLTHEQNTCTTLIVTHEMNFAREVASRIIYMEDGQIVVDSPTEKFFSMDTNSTRIKKFLEKVNI